MHEEKLQWGIPTNDRKQTAQIMAEGSISKFASEYQNIVSRYDGLNEC